MREGNAVAMPVYIADEFDGAMICAKDKGDFADFDDEVLLALGDHAGAVLDTSRLQGELRAAYLGTVRSLADAIEAKDPGVRSHSEEVARYAAAVAARLDLDDAPPRGAAVRLAAARRRQDRHLRAHPAQARPAHRRTSSTSSSCTRASGTASWPASRRWRASPRRSCTTTSATTATGYPAGLRGDRIPLEARIVGVADSFSAMIADRPYSAGRSPEEACAGARALRRARSSTPRSSACSSPRCAPSRRREAPAGDAALDAELDIHREDARGPLGKPAYALVDNLTLLHSAPYLHERAAAEARGRPRLLPRRGRRRARCPTSTSARASRPATGCWSRRPRRCGARRRATGGVACRLSGRALALLVPGRLTGADSLVAGEIGELGEVTAVTWEDGESGYDLIARAQKTVKDSRATGTAGSR